MPYAGPDAQVLAVESAHLKYPELQASNTVNARVAQARGPARPSFSAISPVPSSRLGFLLDMDTRKKI